VKSQWVGAGAEAAWVWALKPRVDCQRVGAAHVVVGSVVRGVVCVRA